MAHSMAHMIEGENEPAAEAHAEAVEELGCWFQEIGRRSQRHQ